MKTFAVILAGGVGARLWPRSREHKPKQFLTLFENRTMLQHTFYRLQPTFAPEDIVVITGESLAEDVQGQLPELPEEHILAEPFGRNTAAAILFALTVLHHHHAEQDVVLTIFPSDHIIYNTRDFLYSASLCAQNAALIDGLVVLGVQPTRPETGFGYIQAMDDTPRVVDTFSSSALHTIRKVSTFAEKPDIETAIRFVNSGDFLWNTGIFAAKASVLWKLFEELLPDHLHLFRLLQKHIGKDTYTETLRMVYRQVRSISVDYSIMEKAKNSYILEGAFDWHDAGSWDSMYQMGNKDAANNVIEGEVVAINVNGSYVSTQKKLIALVDVEDLVVVESDDALLICKRGESQNVKEIIDFMRRKQIKNFL